MRNKLFMEGLGTFLLCVASMMSSSPINVAAILCALVYLGGPISGAQYNPAVTLALRLRGRLGSRSMASFIAIQFAAALLAALFVGLISVHDNARTKDAVDALSEPAFGDFWAASAVSLLGVFFLALVILMVATSRLTSGNSYFGVAIALAYLGLAGTFTEFKPDLNPAFSLASALQGCAIALFGDDGNAGAFGKEFVYLAKMSPRVFADIVVELMGGALAAFTFRRLFPEDR